MLFHLGTTVLLVKNVSPSLEFKHLPGYNYYRTALSVAGKNRRKKNKTKLNQKGIPPILFEPKGPPPSCLYRPEKEDFLEFFICIWCAVPGFWQPLKLP